MKTIIGKRKFEESETAHKDKLRKPSEEDREKKDLGAIV